VCIGPQPHACGGGQLVSFLPADIAAAWAVKATASHEYDNDTWGQGHLGRHEGVNQDYPVSDWQVGPRALR